MGSAKVRNQILTSFFVTFGVMPTCNVRNKQLRSLQFCRGLRGVLIQLTLRAASFRAFSNPVKSDEQRSFVFEQFEIDPTRRQLLKHGSPVALGSRAFELLLFLVRHRGETLSTDAISQEIWPNTHVDKTNLRVHLSAIRKCLEDDTDQPRLITNIPGRGYRFNDNVSATSKTDSPVAATQCPKRRCVIGCR